MTDLNAVARRHEFVLYFDVANGNPNGDPDAGNMPRMDPETGHGLVSDVCLKRKIRNFVEMTKAERDPVPASTSPRVRSSTRSTVKRICASGRMIQKSRTPGELTPKSDEEARRIRQFMCDNFFDIRTFGGVLSTGINAGQVRGPVQLAFGRSVEPILPLEVSITRMAATNDERRRNAARAVTTRSAAITAPWAASISCLMASIARMASSPRHWPRTRSRAPAFPTMISSCLFEALTNMFDHDRSAARGEMATRKLVVFRHNSALGNAPAHKLFERVKTWRVHKGSRHEIGDESDR